MDLSSLSSVTEYSKTFMNLSPGTRILVQKDDKQGIVICVGVKHVFVKWLPFEDYLSAPSMRELPENLKAIGLHPKEYKVIEAPSIVFGKPIVKAKKDKGRLKA